jgi:hypothetical protein
MSAERQIVTAWLEQSVFSGRIDKRREPLLRAVRKRPAAEHGRVEDASTKVVICSPQTKAAHRVLGVKTVINAKAEFAARADRSEVGGTGVALGTPKPNAPAPDPELRQGPTPFS